MVEQETNANKGLYKKVVGNLELSQFMTPSQKGFANALRQIRAFRHKEDKDLPLVLVSTVCPPYSTDCNGRPDYKDLEEGLSPNIEEHLKRVSPIINLMEQESLPVAHIFLMADTEVDLHPFLDKKLGITPDEFLRRCKKSTAAIAQRVIDLYGKNRYQQFELTPANTFLDFFGPESWYRSYDFLKSGLLAEIISEPEGETSRLLGKDYKERRKLVFELLGEVNEAQGIEHIARQRAQYMAFGSLIRERFDKRVFVFNHTTPNFRAINDRRSRYIGGDQYQQETVLFELNISTLPGETI